MESFLTSRATLIGVSIALVLAFIATALWADDGTKSDAEKQAEHVASFPFHVTFEVASQHTEQLDAFQLDIAARVMVQRLHNQGLADAVTSYDVSTSTVTVGLTEEFPRELLPAVTRLPRMSFHQVQYESVIFNEAFRDSFELLALAYPDGVVADDCRNPYLDDGTVDEHAYILGPEALSGNIVTEATAQPDSDPLFLIDFSLSEEGAAQLTELTTLVSAEQDPRNRLALVFDGCVLSAPTVMEPITGGTFTLAGAASMGAVDKDGFALEMTAAAHRLTFALVPEPAV